MCPRCPTNRKMQCEFCGDGPSDRAILGSLSDPRTGGKLCAVRGTFVTIVRPDSTAFSAYVIASASDRITVICQDMPLLDAGAGVIVKRHSDAVFMIVTDVRDAEPEDKRAGLGLTRYVVELRPKRKKRPNGRSGIQFVE